MTTSKVFIIAHVPEEVEHAFLQHIRAFDVAHPGCRLEIGIEPASDIPLVEAVQRMAVEPALSFTAIYERKKQ